MMADPPPAAGTHFTFDANHLALDFANTLEDRIGGVPVERLRRYADLVDWGREADVLGELQAARLLTRAEERPLEAEAALQEACALRETIYRLFYARTRGRPPSRDDLEALNGTLARALAQERLYATAEGAAWGWADSDALDRVLWPVVRAAAELLTAEELARVRECESAVCGWLFLDTTRNRSRRWCDMRVCGNRAKARRHYERSKADRQRSS